MATSNTSKQAKKEGVQYAQKLYDLVNEMLLDKDLLTEKEKRDFIHIMRISLNQQEGRLDASHGWIHYPF